MVIIIVFLLEIYCIYQVCFLIVFHEGKSYDNIPLHILLNITWWKGLGGDILTDYYIQSDKKETQKYSHFLMLGLDKKDLNYLCKKEGHKYMKKYMKN